MFDLISYFTKLLGGGLTNDLWGDLEPIKTLKIFEDIPYNETQDYSKALNN